MSLSDKSVGALGVLAGTAGGFAASSILNASPKAWADLVERVGVPFSCMLLLAVIGAGLIKVIATPLVKTHVDFVASLSETSKANAEAARSNATAITELKTLAISGMEVVKEMQESTNRNQEAILKCFGKLLDQESAKPGENVEK